MSMMPSRPKDGSQDHLFSIQIYMSFPSSNRTQLFRTDQTASDGSPQKLPEFAPPSYLADQKSKHKFNNSTVLQMEALWRATGWGGGEAWKSRQHNS
jgi:hypothetical protein